MCGANNLNLERVNKLQIRLAEQKLDALIVTNRSNVRYLSGFTGSAGMLTIGLDFQNLITDGRYDIQAHHQTKGFNIRITRRPLRTAASILRRKRAKRIGVEAMSLTMARKDELAHELRDLPGRLSGTKGLVEELRVVKDVDEIATLQQAISLTDNAYAHTLTLLRPGVTEKDLALEMEWFMRTNGADSLSFSIIVASGARSALPHGIASEKKIAHGDLVTLDFGALIDGYHADLTRTVTIGKPKQRSRQLYRTVYDAQQRAIAAATNGMLAKKLDAVARTAIKEKGLGKFFTHALGHGLGLDIHEAPTLSNQSKDLLQPNMVVTIEPGIYVPDVGGVRIEDVIRIADDGAEILSQAPSPPKIPIV